MNRSFADVFTAHAPIHTWFGVGGRADTLATPRSINELQDLLHAFAGTPVRVLGDGANLLVHDAGVDGLVLSLQHLNNVETLGGDYATDTPPQRPTHTLVRAEAGANLPKLIVDLVRHGVAGLETLAGIPASVGGAAFMNAGGTFGSIAERIDTIHAITRLGDHLAIPHDQLNFDYRHSGLGWLVITAVDFDLIRLPEQQHPDLRQRLKDVMAHKKSTQPLAERSAGCVFKNPIVRGERASAGKLIDDAGCKGLAVGGARVSDKHANFIVTTPGCTAQHIIDLMHDVARRVRQHHGVELEPEITIWKRGA